MGSLHEGLDRQPPDDTESQLSTVNKLAYQTLDRLEKSEQRTHMLDIQLREINDPSEAATMSRSQAV